MTPMELLVVAAVSLTAILARLALGRYRRHPDRVAHLDDMTGRYPLRARNPRRRPWM